jgi:hypothetical protein
MEQNESEPQFRTINWLEDESGHYFNLKTQAGIYDIRPENTAVFQFGDPTIDHIYRITDDSGESFMGFRLYRYQLDQLGYNFEQVCDDMTSKGFQLVYDEEPNQEEIQAYINAGNEYEPEIKTPTPMRTDAEAILQNYDKEFEYFLGEGGEWR